MFQFIRAEVYARRASTNEKSKSQFNASDVIGEALRDEGHCPHVEKPEAPRYLFGSEAGTRAILGRIQENAAQYRDKMGRKMREDAAVNPFFYFLCLFRFKLPSTTLFFLPIFLI